MKLDLHIHSDISLDGQYLPGELAVFCARASMKWAALTDHNSVRGVKGFICKAEAAGIRALPGIELDCVLDSTNLHLLGYEVDAGDRRFWELEEEVLNQKRTASEEQMRMLSQMGIMFDRKEVLKLSKNGIVVGEMIAEAALADKRNENNTLLSPYRPGGKRCDNPYVNFFWDFCSQGSPAFIPVSYVGFEEALELITDTGGFAVIAHPSKTVGRRMDQITYMAECGVKGMEVFSSYHDSRDVEYFRAAADRLKLVKTAGSDFHGKTKPSVRLGDTNGMTEEDSGELEEFLEKWRS